MAKGSHPGRKKTPQYPGKKLTDPSQPQISSFFYPLKKISNVSHLPIFSRQTPPILTHCNDKFSYVYFSPLKTYVLNTNTQTFQTCDSKPLIPKPPPARLSEMVAGSSKVAIRDDSYWENLNKVRMPDCFMQAIVAIESPSLVPCVAIHSVEGEGRKKRWFSCIIRDSMTRPCNTPIILLSPDEELLDSLQITTFSAFSASEAFKITQTFPTILAGTSKPRETCENKSS